VCFSLDSDDQNHPLEVIISLLLMSTLTETMSSSTPIMVTTVTPPQQHQLNKCQGKSWMEEIEFSLPPNHYEKIDWIDTSIRPMKLFADTYGIHPIDDATQTTSKYFTMTSCCHANLRKATTELHQMFTQASEHVLSHPEFWPYFGFPEQFWPLAIKSFQRGDKNLSGRFDFAISSDYGIKCYEYNADSASCLIECAHTQNAWSKAMNLDSLGGVDGGIGAAKRVTTAWSKLFQPNTLVHFLFDNTDREECVHTAYVIYLAEQAGIRCKEVPSVDGFQFNEEGMVLDAEGDVVHHVWKSWNYTTLLEILEKEGGSLRHSAADGEVRLIDICFHESISILEPLWSAIPSNKAILPILSELFPESPYLLYSSFTLTDKLIKNGYCSKPVLGRGGQNIAIHYPPALTSELVIDDKDPNYVPQVNETDTQQPSTEDSGATSATTADSEAFPTSPMITTQDNDITTPLVVAPGKFSDSPTVYQELAILPKFNGLYTQINTFSAYGHYAGTVIRVEASAIVGYNSNVFVLRVINDESGTPLPGEEIEF
jgi:glutathionylspermidine synthase